MKPEVLNPDHLDIVYVDISKITPYFNNPKIHSAKNISKLIKSMTTVKGRVIFHQPIVLDKQNVIIAGHGRRLASIELGLTQVPCTYLDVSEQEAIALRLADNEAFGLDYDLQKMQEELNKIASPAEIDLKPHSVDEMMNELNAIIDDVPTPDINKIIDDVVEEMIDDDDEKPDRLETQLCKKISASLNGETEVKTPIGYIDIETDSEIIEVKRVRKWKWALGQILVYGLYRPDKQKRIHLFGRCKDSKLKTIKEHCAKFDVVVTWQYEEFRP